MNGVSIGEGFQLLNEDLDSFENEFYNEHDSDLKSDNQAERTLKNNQEIKSSNSSYTEIHPLPTPILFSKTHNDTKFELDGEVTYNLESVKQEEEAAIVKSVSTEPVLNRSDDKLSSFSDELLEERLQDIISEKENRATKSDEELQFNNEIELNSETISSNVPNVGSSKNIKNITQEDTKIIFEYGKESEQQHHLQFKINLSTTAIPRTHSKASTESTTLGPLDSGKGHTAGVNKVSYSRTKIAGKKINIFQVGKKNQDF